MIQGKVINQTSGLSIKDVTIYTPDSAYLVKSKNSGKYHFSIPKKINTLIFSHDDYITKEVSFKSSKRVLDVKLDRLIPDSSDLVNHKYSISFLPIKLITGAFSLRFEKFINKKKSVGAYLTYYYDGRQYFGSEEFTGLKTSFYFRYYFVHKQSHGFYAQGSIIIAYFDFDKLNYNYSNQLTKSISTSFWTGGFGAAVGITDIVKNSKHFIFDINIGWQIMPALYKTTITDEHGRELDHNNLWWYIGGPGSVVEIKLAIGGIF